jgi:hypothetical protein
MYHSLSVAVVVLVTLVAVVSAVLYTTFASGFVAIQVVVVGMVEVVVVVVYVPFVVPQMCFLYSPFFLVHNNTVFIIIPSLAVSLSLLSVTTSSTSLS